MSNRFGEIKIGRFTVRFKEGKTECKYVVYDSQMKKFSEGISSSKEKIIEEVQNSINTQKKAMVSSRINGIPTAHEFAKAFSSLKLSDGQWAMLKAHYNAKERKLTSSQLAEAANYEHFYAANTQYGTLGRDVCDYLDVKPPGTYNDGNPLWITILTLENSDAFEDETGHYQHTMRQEVADALEIVGGI